MFLSLSKAEKNMAKLNQLQSKIDFCENKINNIFYQLYNLTASEIKVLNKKD